MLMHEPCSLQSLVQLRRWQALPVKPSMQLQSPNVRSQVPRLEHSGPVVPSAWPRWAVSSARAMSDQAVPMGQTNSEQSPPWYPSQQSQRE